MCGCLALIAPRGAVIAFRESRNAGRVPGDAGAVMTTLDDNPMARAGEAGRALSLSAVAYFVGGTFTVIQLSVFSPADYVALMVFAFASLASLVGKSTVKRLLGAMIGLMLATIGIDANAGVPRYTFGIPDFFAGVDFLIVVVGLFGMAELLKTFGKGDPRGLAAPEAANNAAAGGAMVPMLTLGIPGSGTTAILLGALLMFNIQPGPTLFSQRPEVAWGLVASMYIGNVALLVINLPLVGLFAWMLAIPQHYLTPLIAILAFIGIYTIVGNPHDLFMITLLGIFGWFLRKLDFSLAPVILGFVLGSLFENNLRRALSISGGDWGMLISDYKSVTLYVLAVLVVAAPIWLARRARLMEGNSPLDQR